jgi:signal transduction histidine kinase
MLRENFAAIVSHELKSPLGALQQNLFALSAELEDKLSDEQKQRFERLTVRLEDLVKLIHSWLRILSVDINKLKDTFQPVALPVVVTKAVETVQPHATRKAIEIQPTLVEPLPAIQGDEGSLVEVLVNLLGNAVKYSHPESKITVRVQAQGPEVLLAVADTGVGITKEDMAHLFQDFGRGQKQPEGVSGAGLGLAISHRIIEVHGGAITVESEPGKGSTFTVRLPAAPTTAPSPSHPTPEPKV